MLSSTKSTAAHTPFGTMLLAGWEAERERDEREGERERNNVGSLVRGAPLPACPRP